MKKRKPVKMKTYRTWCVVMPDGTPESTPEKKDTPLAKLRKFLWLLEAGARIARVEVRGVER